MCQVQVCSNLKAEVHPSFELEGSPQVNLPSPGYVSVRRSRLYKIWQNTKLCFTDNTKCRSTLLIVYYGLSLLSTYGTYALSQINIVYYHTTMYCGIYTCRLYLHIFYIEYARFYIEYVHNTNTILDKTDWHVLNTYLSILNIY